MNTQIIHTLTLELGETLEKKKSTVEKQPNYIKIGNGTMNKHKIKSINLVKVMNEVSSNGRALITAIVDGMVFNPHTGKVDFIVVVTTGDAITKRQLTQGYKELVELELVKRVSRSKYMLNPNAVVTDYSEQLAVWENSSKAKSTTTVGDIPTEVEEALKTYM